MKLNLFCILGTAFYAMACGHSSYATDSVTDGGGSTGGGSAVGGIITSLAENEGSMLIDPLHLTDHPNVSTIIRAVLNELDHTVPRFRHVLTASLTTKEWYFEAQSLLNCPDEGAMITVDQRTVACQNNFEIRISSQWFYHVAASDEQRAAIFIHEMNRSLFMASNYRIRPEAVHILDRLLMSRAAIRTERMRDRLRDLGYGTYETFDEVSVRLREILGIRAIVCESVSPSMSLEEVAQNPLFRRETSLIERLRPSYFLELRPELGPYEPMLNAFSRFYPADREQAKVILVRECSRTQLSPTP